MADRNKILRTVKLVAELLARGEYEAIAKMGLGGSLSPIEIEFGVSEYPCKLIAPPEEAYQEIRIYDADFERADGFRCLVEFPLWTVEEGRSDLFLLLSLYEKQGDYYGFTFDDLDVP